MKKFKFLSVLLIASAMSLAGCNETQPQGPTDGGDGTHEGGEGQGGGEQGGGGSEGGGEQGGGEQGGGGSQGGGGEQGGDTEKTTTILIADFGLPKETVFGTQTMSGFTIKTEAGTNSSNPPIAPKIYEEGKELRVYAGNVVTISGAQIKKITFTATYKNNGVVEFESGTFADLVWQGDTDSVKFSCTTGQFRITQLDIVYTGEGGGSQGGEGGEGGEGTFTPDGVLADILEYLEIDATPEYYEPDGCYYVQLAYDVQEGDTLLSVMEDLYDELKDAFVTSQEPYTFQYEEDNSDGAGFSLYTEDYSVFLDIYDWVDEEDESVFVLNFDSYSMIIE